jgi:methyl-accepting chemotaxis protein WspA
MKSVWTIKKQVLVGFVLIIITALMMSAFTIAYLSHILKSADLVATNSLPSIDTITDIATNMEHGHAMLLQHLVHSTAGTVSADEHRKFEADLEEGTRKNNQLLKEYEKTILDDEDRKTYNTLVATREAYNAVRKEMIERSTHKVEAETLRLLDTRLDPAYDAYIAAAHKVIDYNRGVALSQCKDIARMLWLPFIITIVGFIGVLGLFVIISIYINRRINRPLASLGVVMGRLQQGDFTVRAEVARQDEIGLVAEAVNRMIDDLKTLVLQVQRSGIQVSTSVTEIAATTKEQQSTANEVAATTTEIGATSKEIYATSKELARTSEEVNAVAEQTADLAAAGKEGLVSMEANMRSIMAASASVTAKLTDINDKVGNIGAVVTTITKVADQTNLLSLNAAIEAEKAGEYGRGFSVVATEIRRLADQTAEATLDIERMVKEMTSAVSAGVMGMDKFSEEVRHGVDEVTKVGRQLDTVISQVQSLAPSFDAVSEGMSSQTLGAQQISDALIQLSEAMQQTVDSLRQSNLAIEQLNEASQGLRNGVSRFTLA